ncbi:MAG: tripartite tricarboxylate transporter permease, partial [Rhodospirillales bacterium]|nr:tripartite tricarboxylate transporter permease [Rhodospirillales bacterium]
METIHLLADGFGIAFLPINLGLVVLGVTVGLFIGAMPGLGSVNGVAILLPMTFLVPPTSAIIFLAAIYYGAMYGGAISSIMLGIPGASTAVATTFDGRPLAMKGLADKALISAAIASFVGGTLSIIMFTLFAPPLASWALAFGDPELFALMMMAFATFVGLSGDDIPKTLFSICIGLVLSSVGLDIMSGEPR